MKTHKFKGAEYELNIKRKEDIRCRVWFPDKDNCSVVVYAYGYGDTIDSEHIEKLAESIVNNNDVAVVVVEYSGTDLKYSEDLLSKLEDRLPMFLDNIIEYVPQNVKKLIKTKQYQEAINGLYFNAYLNYPITKNTIIQLYGDENNYNDFGLTAALDIIYSIVNLKKIYGNWNWDDCIGYGKDYGAYLIEMVERFQPGTFSMILNIQGNLAPQKEDLFYNYTEWENNGQKNAHIKKIGKFPMYLVDVQGWTTVEDHPNHFNSWNFDIRNLSNKDIINSIYNKKKTPRIYVDLYNLDEKYLSKRKKYIHDLINHGYSVEYFLVEQNDIENYIFNKKDDKIEIDLIKLFNYYLEEGYYRNVKDNINYKLLWYPVNSGVYVIYKENEFPKIIFLDKNNLHDEDNIKTYEKIKSSNESEDILKYIETPIEKINEDYIKLID